MSLKVLLQHIQNDICSAKYVFAETLLREEVIKSTNASLLQRTSAVTQMLWLEQLLIASKTGNSDLRDIALLKLLHGENKNAADHNSLLTVCIIICELGTLFSLDNEQLDSILDESLFVRIADNASLRTYYSLKYASNVLQNRFNVAIDVMKSAAFKCVNAQNKYTNEELYRVVLSEILIGRILSENFLPVELTDDLGKLNLQVLHIIRAQERGNKELVKSNLALFNQQLKEVEKIEILTFYKTASEWLEEHQTNLHIKWPYDLHKMDLLSSRTDSFSIIEKLRIKELMAVIAFVDEKTS